MHPLSVSTGSWSGLVLIVASSLVACGEGEGEGMTDPPDGEETPELRKVTFMTYNIYGAGGVTPDGEEREEDHDYGVGDERLFLVLDVIKAYNADVVGLQEVWWSAEDTVYANGGTTADSVSTLTGMYHWVERGEGAPFHSDAGLLSRYPFIGRDYFESPTFDRYILKANLVDDYGEPWIVYNMHLQSYQEDDSLEALRTNEREYVRDHVLASDDTLAIVMGDMNCSADSMQMYLPGWTLIASVVYPNRTNGHDLDQVWISGDLSKVWGTVTVDLRDHPDYSQLIDDSSDHYPTAAMVFLPIQ